MATHKLVAIHWDKAQLLIVTAQCTAGTLRVDRAELVDLDANDPLDTVARHLKKLGIQRGETTIVVPRSQVEMRQLEVPPVPQSELPDLVRFQAQSQFASLTDDWALDYVPVAENGHIETVLAAAISKNVIADLRQAIEPVGLKVQHVVIRPFSAVELIRTHVREKTTCLILNQFETEIELTVAVDGYVNLSRSIRVSAPEGANDNLPGYAENIIVREVRRTIASAANQSSPVHVDRIIICGEREKHSLLEQQLDEQFELPIEFFNPFDAVKVTAAAKKHLPTRAGRFTPLLGSLVQQVSRKNHAVDFLNPRQTAKRSNTKRRLIVFGSLAATLLVLVLGWFFLTVQARNAEIARLEIEYNSLLQGNEGIEEIIGDVQLVDEWTRQSVAWVEEIDQISRRYLYPDDARANSLIASFRQRQPIISLKGQTADFDAKARLVEELQTRPYVVENLLGQESVGNSEMRIDYNINLLIEQDENSELLVDRIRQAAKQTGGENKQSLDDQREAQANSERQKGRVNDAG